MPKIRTINQNYLFRRLYAKGKRFSHPVLVSYFLRKRSGVLRVGITTSKKIGGAVKRNRARRVIMAAYRELYPSLLPGADIVFVATQKTSQVKSTEILPVMSAHLSKFGLIKK